MTDQNQNNADQDIQELQDVAQNLSELLTNSVNMVDKYYEIFFDQTPHYVELQQYDSEGQLYTTLVPNRAMDRTIALSGEGSPEGKVEAQLGTLYVDVISRDLYIKKTVIGSIGWENITPKRIYIYKEEFSVGSTTTYIELTHTTTEKEMVDIYINGTHQSPNIFNLESDGKTISFNSVLPNNATLLVSYIYGLYGIQGPAGKVADVKVNGTSVVAGNVANVNIKTINNTSIVGSGNVDIDTLPSQTGQGGKFLTTNGTNPSWQEIPTEVDGETISLNTDDELQAIGIKDNRNAATLKYWTGTRAQYNAITNKDSNTIYNITDDTGGTITEVAFSAITGQPTDNTNLATALNAKANNNAVVKLTGNQTVAGVKTFTGNPVFQSGAYNTAIAVNNTAGRSSAIQFKSSDTLKGSLGVDTDYSIPTFWNSSGTETALVRSTISTAVGSATQPVYINSSGVATAITSYSGNSATATTASNANNLKVTEHSDNDITYYPIWANGEGGIGTNRQCYVTKDKLKFIPASGTLTATTFSGGYDMKKSIVDLSNTSTYLTTTWYPVTGTVIPTTGLRRISLNVQLNSGTKPSWSSHSAGFTAIIDMLATSGGWGRTYAPSILLNKQFLFIASGESNPASYRQLENSSTPVFYLRGGGKYFIYTDYDCSWTIRTSSTTIAEQTIAPSTTLPADSYVKSAIGANLTGNVTGNCSGSSGSCTGNSATATTLQNLTATVSELNYTDGVTSNIQTQLNAKVDVASLSTINPMITSYVNGTSGYNIWANGYCEQWGVITEATASTKTVTFTKTFANTNYIFLRGAYQDYNYTTVLSNKTTSSISIYTNAETVMWKASGYLASGEY